MDGDLFFDDKRAQLAKAVCAGCPVASECLADGHGQPGVWGGKTKDERKAERPKRKMASGWHKQSTVQLTPAQVKRLNSLSGDEQRAEAIRLGKSGVTQKELALELGVNQSTVSKWIRKGK